MTINWQSRPNIMDKDNAKKVLFEVKDILDKHNIEFWLCFATCLGAIREKDFIDIDFDIDLGIKHNILLPKLGILKDEFEKAGYDTYYLSTPYSYNRMLKVQKDEIRVDLVNWDICEEFYFHPMEPDGKCDIYYRDMFDNLIEIDFLGKQFKVPTPVEQYLEITYGIDWRIKNEHYNFLMSGSLRFDYWNSVVKKVRKEGL